MDDDFFHPFFEDSLWMNKCPRKKLSQRYRANGTCLDQSIWRIAEDEKPDYCSLDKDRLSHDSINPEKSKGVSTGGFSLAAIFLIWIVILIISLIALRLIRIRWFSAIVFAAIISSILFLLFLDFNSIFDNINNQDDNNKKYSNYNTGKTNKNNNQNKNKKNKDQDNLETFLLVPVLTAILLGIYVIWKVFTDFDYSRIEECFPPVSPPSWKSLPKI